jgi:hypothetical protein
VTKNAEDILHEKKPNFELKYGHDSMTENSLMRLIMQVLGHGKNRLFRNNVGMGWTGVSSLEENRHTVVLQGARRIRFGLCVGSSDLIGWRQVTITQSMVGMTIAQFVAIEVKASNSRERGTEEQRAFVRVVQDAGGCAAIVRSVAEAANIMETGNDQ